MTFLKAILPLIGLSMIAALVACSSSSSTTTTTPPPPAITVALSTPPPASLAANFGTATIAATTNDTAGVNWTCAPANSCGTFSSPGSLTGVTNTYTTPTAVPTGNTVTITATSVTDTSQSASATVIVTNVVATTLAAGNYVFSLSGADSNGSFYSVAGAFTVASGGAITTGEQDFVDAAIAAVHDPISSCSNCISTTSDGNIQITLNTGDVNLGPGGNLGTGTGTETLDASLVSTSKAVLTEFDSWASASGELDLQTANPATPLGAYAFFTTGLDANDAPVSIGGVINVGNAGGISGTGSIFDINDDGVPSSAQTFTASTVSPPSSDGLGMVTFTLNPSSASGISEISLVGYIVDASHIRLVETSDGFVGTTGGTALGQTGAFNTSSISGSSYVFGTDGQDFVSGAQQLAGLLTFNSDGSVSGNLSFNDITSQSPQGGNTLATGATYSVDPTGDVTVTGLTDATGDFTYNLQLYLTGAGHALVISMDAADVLAGLGYQQTGSYTAASFSGTYALNIIQQVPPDSTPFEQDGVGTVALDGVGSLIGFIDLDEALPTNDLPLSGTFSANANGVFTGTITGISSTSATNADMFTYYLGGANGAVANGAVAIENDSDQLTLGIFQIQQ
jgi:hypothetical protein